MPNIEGRLARLKRELERLQPQSQLPAATVLSFQWAPGFALHSPEVVAAAVAEAQAKLGKVGLVHVVTWNERWEAARQAIEDAFEDDPTEVADASRPVISYWADARA